MADISAIKTPDNSTYNLKDATVRDSGWVTYGTCTTAGSERVKVITLSNANWQLKVGSIIGAKFSNTNSYNSTADAPAQLNVNSTGAIPVYYGDGAAIGTSATVLGFANRTLFFMYNGTHWVWISTSLHTDTYTAAYCITGASTAAKTAVHTNFKLLAKSYTLVTLANTNTATSELTLNINSTGAKTIYIDGTVTSASNYTLPAGTYLVYYDGTNYHFRTDGKLTSDGKIVATVDDISGGGGSQLVAYGTCSTSSITGTKVVTLEDSTNWELTTGCIIGVYFSSTNSVTSDGALNVNSTGAIRAFYNGRSTVGVFDKRALGVAGRITYYMYADDKWRWMCDGYDTDTDSDTIPATLCKSIGSTAYKVASHSNFTLLSKSYTLVTMAESNTAKSALTLTVGSANGKPIYINGNASSASNYTLPAGTYLVYYDGTNYYFRTDGRIPSNGGYALTSKDTVGINQGGTSATTITNAKTNLRIVRVISGNTTWSSIYSELNALATEEMCMIVIPSDSFAIITNNKLTNAFRGCFCKTSSTYWDFFGSFGNGGFCTVRLASPTSSSVGTVTAQAATMTTL